LLDVWFFTGAGCHARFGTPMWHRLARTARRRAAHGYRPHLQV